MKDYANRPVGLIKRPLKCGWSLAQTEKSYDAEMKPTRRTFIGSAAVIGVTTVSQAALGGLSSSGQSAAQGPDAGSSSGEEQAVPVTIRVAAGKPTHSMRGGMGASFHAIAATLPGMRPNGGSYSGSAWGGNPDAGDDKHWEELFKHAEWLGLNWCRVEIEQRMYEPGPRVFDWDNAEMKALYRILDWAERRGVDVFLQQMWSDVVWNAYPGNAADPIKRLRSAPYSIPEWAFGLGEFLNHLTRVKGYECIRWVSISNEPGHDDFSWWQDSDMKALPITPGLKAAREEFDRRGLAVPISGPDWTDLPELKPAEVDFDAYIGAYDLHSYSAVFDSMGGGTKLTASEKILSQWAEWAHARNKPLFLSEFGTMAFGWGHIDAAPACYQSGLKNASLIVRAINVGVDGFNRWSFTNRGDLDGQWQLLRTWDVDHDKLLETFSPQPNAYYQYAMLTRYLPKYSGVLGTQVEGPYLACDRKLVAAALRTPKGNYTLLLVNESHRAADARFEFKDLPAALRLHRYSLTKETEDRSKVELRSDRALDVSGSFTDRVPPMSIVVYSTYGLTADDPGIIAE